MIGRNGHLRWSEALQVLEPFWQELPLSYRFNHLTKRTEPTFVNRDYSEDSLEGIRAQDILPLLVESFHFHFFVPFANVVIPFVDRAFGPNFNVEKEWDRDFIDRVHAADEAAIIAGDVSG
jgi:hypothetical protein